MELIDIIKSSILLFSFLLLTIVFISFALFKIRNQAKQKAPIVKNIEDEKILPEGEIKAKKLNIIRDKEHSKKNYPNSEITKNKEKFVVINNISSTPIGAYRVNYHPNVYKFYAELNPKIMFKIKPETSTKS